MTATRTDISSWFDAGKTKGATHLIVVCDTFDYEDFPIYVMPNQDAREVAQTHGTKAMQRVMEVYALHLDKSEQMAEWRAFHYEKPDYPDGTVGSLVAKVGEREAYTQIVADSIRYRGLIVRLAAELERMNDRHGCGQIECSSAMNAVIEAREELGMRRNEPFNV